MVRRLTAGVLVTAGLMCARAGEIEPRLSPARLPAISTIDIRENGARAPAAKDKAEHCEEFRLDERDVARFFRSAGEVTQHDYLHMLEWSACYAAGDVVFKDGRRAKWGINHRRGGSLRFADGRVIYLYCPRCRGSMFAPN